MKNRPVQLFAVVPPGLETLCAHELLRLGVAATRPVRGGVEFVGGLRELYQANLWLRCASRLLVRVGDFHCRDFPGMFRKCRQLAWGQFVRPGQPLTIRVTSRKSRLFHTDRVEQVVREAVAQALGNADLNPDLEPGLLVVQVVDDHCQISVDSSGEHLHRRGYRRHAVPAPLRENLAAGLLLQTGWAGDRPLLDPLCGSGTLVIEAALLAAEIPPGRNRSFGFMGWPGFRPGLWNNLLDQAERRTGSPPTRLIGRDLSSAAVQAARQNADAAGVAEWIDWEVGDVMDLAVSGDSGLVISNPPYGSRLGEPARLPEWYARLGQVFNRACRGWQLALVVPEPTLVSGWGRGMQSQLRFRNGGLEVHFMCSGRENT